MRRLVDHEFVVENAGGWQINGWDEFQLASDEAKARRAKAQRAAAARWSKHQKAAPDA